MFGEEVSFLYVAAAAFDLDHFDEAVDLVLSHEEVLGFNVLQHVAACVEGFGRFVCSGVVGCNGNGRVEAGVFRVDVSHQPGCNSIDVNRSLTCFCSS